MLFNKRFKRYEDLLEYEAIERGKAQGRKEGAAEGKAEGQRLALKTVLQTLLNKAGDAAPADAANRIETADVAQLDRWVMSLLQGGDPRQAFAEN